MNIDKKVKDLEDRVQQMEEAYANNQALGGEPGGGDTTALEALRTEVGALQSDLAEINVKLDQIDAAIKQTQAVSYEETDIAAEVQQRAEDV